MKKWLAMLLLLSLVLAAPEEINDELFWPQSGGSAIRELSLDGQPLVDYENPWQMDMEENYIPGQTVSFNVQKNIPELEVNSLQAVILGETVQLYEYAKDIWTGYYALPENLPEGELAVTISAGTTEVLQEKLSIAYPLSRIEVKGLTVVSENTVLEEVLLNPGEFYSQLKAEVNRQRILALGFFEQVSFSRRVENQNSVLLYTVRENPRLQKIVVSGNRAFSEKELREIMVMRPGEILSNIQLQKDIVAVERLYQDNDYMFARISAIDRPSSANGYSLTYRISEGELGAIQVIGNDVTREYVITREMELKPGDVFNASLLREDLRNIYNLNYFSTLVLDLRFNEETEKIDLDIRVEEKKTSSINFGGGYGQIQGWFGFVDLFLDNLGGTGQSLLFKSQFAERITSYQIRYHNPWMWNNKTSFTGKMWSTYGFNYLSGQRELRNGWATTIGFRRTKNINDSFTFRYEDIFNVDDRSQDYQDRAVGYTIAYDTRDQWMNPTTGFYNVFSMDHSSKLLGGNINASRYGIQFNQFFSLAEKQVLALREMYDYQLGDILPSEQYYAGSDSTVRGYRSIFAKGTERSILNAEYRYIFTDMFVGVLFYDIGQAVQPVYDPLDIDRDFVNLHGWGSSQGFGVRIITPMGPIRLDYGWPQYKEFADGFLSFNIGNTF